MAGITKAIFFALVVAYSASFYQLFVKDLLTITFGVGRVMQSIDEFPFDCRRIEHPRLEACEDIWLDNEGRTLYAACAGTQGRLAWNQAMGQVNVTGRRPGGSEFIALDIGNPGADGLFNFRAIKPTGNYRGATGNKELDLLGFDAHVLDDSTIQFYFINQRPPVGPSNEIIDATKTGDNSTVEIFEMRRGQDTMRHVRTIFSSEIWTPNRIAALGDGSGAFLLTNDHSKKVGSTRQLDYFLGGGNVAYCSGSGDCHAAYWGNEMDETLLSRRTPNPLHQHPYVQPLLSLLPRPKLKFPNGLTRGFDGLYYVPSAIDGQVRVFALQPSNHTLRLLDTIHVGMPVDNISPDANGDLYAAAFPNLVQAGKGFADPYNEISPVTIWRIRKTVDERDGVVRSVDYRVEKVLEDRDSKVLSGSTTVRHDAKTGRLFVSAAVHPFLVVCEPR
ncbi:serum paraoxonase arylesterase [Curvularia clavata]|uniref:Serum paraoxonase arylesterase n=1 Tax=Curvularia clavata TaxID=95742 RepID=A0A9Q9DRE5_CURCL|nr:serum paraoxonase arylesterase [Curvularia clavata]